MDKNNDYRLGEVSIFEVALCLCVIYIHAASDAVSLGEKSSLFTIAVFALQRLVYFAMPGFIFSSGLKMSLKMKREGDLSYWIFIRGRLMKILPSYFFWVIVFYLYLVYARTYFPFELSELAQYILKGNVASHFYFIPVLLQFYVIAPFAVRLAQKTKPATGIAVSLAVSVATLWAAKNFSSAIMWDRIFPTYLIFYCAGIYAGLNIAKLKEFLARYSALLASACFISACGYIYATSSMFLGIRSFAEIPVELAQMAYRMIMIAGLFALSSAVDGVIPSKARQAATYLHRANFYVFLCHPLAMFIAQDNLPYGATMLSRFLARAASGTIASFAVCILYLWAKDMIVSSVLKN
ncbi:MAG: acyltransferase [Clostridiales bacterium]|nr:acyltransferase [Clostridiales bacterium]